MWGPLLTGEKETKIENYSVGIMGPPVGMDHGDHCLKADPKLGFQLSGMALLMIAMYVYF